MTESPADSLVALDIISPLWEAKQCILNNSSHIMALPYNIFFLKLNLIF